MHLLHCMFFEKASHTPLNAIKMRCSFLVSFFSRKSMVAERAQCTAKKEKKHLQIKKTTSSIWQHMHCKCSQHSKPKKSSANNCFFGCVVNICSAFLYLFALLVFAVLVVKLMKTFSWFCWCFFYLHVFLQLQRLKLYLGHFKNQMHINAYSYMWFTFPIFLKELKETLCLYTHVVSFLCCQASWQTLPFACTKSILPWSSKEIAEYRRICN